MKNKFILIENGSRGYIEDVTVEETELTLQEFAEALHKDNIADLYDIYGEDSEDEDEVEDMVQDMIADFGIGFKMVNSTSTMLDEIAVVCVAEESSFYIIEYSDEMFNALQNDNVRRVKDAEELIGIEY